MKNYIYLLFVIVIISCSSVKEQTQDDSTTIDSHEEKMVIDISNSYVKRMEFEADIQTKSSLGDYNLTGEFKIENNDKISITIYGPFGITVGRIYSDTNEIRIHNAIQNIYYVGKPSEDNIFKISGMNLSIKGIINLIRSEPIYINTEYFVDKTFKDGTLLKRVDSRNFADFVLLNSNYSIKEYQRKDSKNETLVRALLDDYSNTKNYKLAKSLNITLPSNNLFFKYLTNNIKVNSDAASPDEFSIPKNARVININDLE